MVAFHFVQLLFWIALATWFGGVLFVAMASQVIFQTVRESDPMLPTVLSVNLEGQHGTLLAGSIVANLLAMLARVELYCAGGLLLALIGQWIVLDPARNWPIHTIRSGLYVTAVAIVLYELLRLGPQIRNARAEYIDNADNPEVANPAKERFDALHKESVSLLTLLLAVLLGMILFSAGLTRPATTAVQFPTPAAASR
jgi:hypothetical protein